MRSVLALGLVAACAHGAPAPAPSTPAAPARTLPSEADITRRSHDVLDAFDRGEVATLSAALAVEFLHFEGGEPLDRDAELAQLTKRQPGASYIAKRSWEHERVFVHADAAVFIGKATEQQGGNDIHGGGYKYVGWYMLQWVREADAWKLRLWTWQRGGAASERETWNEIYRNGVGFDHEPNRLLVETVKGKQPGAALDLAMGQGRNALYLAAEGWKVTGVDLSDEGLQHARAAAARKQVTLETINANLDDWDFGKQRWDLVTMIYAGNAAAWFEKIKPSLRPGGLFVLEYFAHDPARGQDDGMLAGQLAKVFAAGFQIVRDEVVEDTPDWAMDRAKLVRFVARKL